MLDYRSNNQVPKLIKRKTKFKHEALCKCKFYVFSSHLNVEFVWNASKKSKYENYSIIFFVVLFAVRYCVACIFRGGNQCWCCGEINGRQIGHQCRGCSEGKAFHSFPFVFITIRISLTIRLSLTTGCSSCRANCPRSANLPRSNRCHTRCTSAGFAFLHLSCTVSGLPSLQTALNVANLTQFIMFLRIRYKNVWDWKSYSYTQ